MTGLRPLILAVACLVAACSRGDALAARRGAPDDTVRVNAASTPRNECPVRPGELRLDADTVMGLPAPASIRDLAALCPAARLDTVGVGGTSPVALRMDAPGVTVWAIQSRYDAYEDTLHRAEPPDLWAVLGDSVRFPDGRRIPRRVGELRAIDSTGVVVVDRGDDGTGSYIVVCRYPALAFIVGNTWPPHASGPTLPFSRVSIQDTTSMWRVEITPHRVDENARKVCRTPSG